MIGARSQAPHRGFVGVLLGEVVTVFPNAARVAVVDAHLESPAAANRAGL